MILRLWQSARTRLGLSRPQPQPFGMILLYHRVVDLSLDPQLLAVSPQNFDVHLQVLAEETRVLPLTEFLRPSDTTLDRPVCAITFDDGYQDNLLFAKPLLHKHKVPATCFVTSSAIGSDREFCWDELERLLLTPNDLPQHFALRIDGSNFEWDLGDTAHYSDSLAKSLQTWNVLSSDTPTPRHQAYRELSPILKSLSLEGRNGLLEQLRGLVQVSAVGRHTHRAMTRAELESFPDDLVTVGAHSVSHPQLSKLSLADQKIELRESRVALEAMLRQEVPSFAYPYGSLVDYDAETVNVARKHFSLACANTAGRVTSQSDPHQLPRFLVRNWSAEEFRHHLRAWWQG